MEVLLKAGDLAVAQSPYVAHLGLMAPTGRLIRPRIPTLHDDGVSSVAELLRVDGQPKVRWLDPFRVGRVEGLTIHSHARAARPRRNDDSGRLALWLVPLTAGSVPTPR